MLVYKFHDLWTLPFMVLFCITHQSIAQCPLTKSATFAMVENGLPSQERLEPIDFFVNPAEVSSYHNLKVDRDNFRCRDVGIQKITLSGEDSLGNAFTCREFLWVYDSVLLCSNQISNPRVIGGKVTTEDGQLLSDVTIQISDRNVNYFRGTDQSGLFLFENFDTASYVLSPSTPSIQELRNGISTFDVLLLQKHILGLKSLGSPYKIIAADLNSSNSLTAYDMVLLRQTILSIIDQFPDTPSWKYVDASYQFENENDPFLEDFPEDILIDAVMETPSLNHRFIGIKIGDLNNSVKVNKAAGRSAKKARDYLIKVDNQEVSEGMDISVPIKLSTDEVLEGMQFALKFDADQVDFLSIDGNDLITSSNYEVAENKILFSWTNPNIALSEAKEFSFTIHFKSKNAIGLKEVLRLATSELAAELYVQNEPPLSFDFLWENPIGKGSLEVANNYPNPFSEQTKIPFYLSQNQTLHLSIFNKNGKEVYATNQFFEKGNHHFTLSNVFEVGGIYFYKIADGQRIKTGKLHYLPN
jgi:hypothetical protein